MVRSCPSSCSAHQPHQCHQQPGLESRFQRRLRNPHLDGPGGLPSAPPPDTTTGEKFTYRTIAVQSYGSKQPGAYFALDVTKPTIDTANLTTTGPKFLWQLSKDDKGNAFLGKGFFSVEMHFGFFETPNVPRALDGAPSAGLDSMQDIAGSHAAAGGSPSARDRYGSMRFTSCPTLPTR